MQHKASFTTLTRFSSSITMPAITTLFRVDIIPTLSLFPIANTASRFLTYKINTVGYQLIPRFNISSTPGTLPIIYSVPVDSNQLPLANVAAFNSYANCKFTLMTRPFSGSFKPMAYTDSS